MPEQLFSQEVVSAGADVDLVDSTFTEICV